MIFDGILWFGMAALACVGFVHLAAWVGIRAACRGNSIYRVIPIGGAGKNAGNQMSFMYICLQWESNPSRQAMVLYDAGLDEQTARDCQILADASGVRFVRSPQELLALLIGEESAV